MNKARGLQALPFLVGSANKLYTLPLAIGKESQALFVDKS
jgi:hypothetical protein